MNLVKKTPFGIKSIQTAPIAQSPNIAAPSMIIPVQAWFFVTEVPTLNPDVQTVIADVNAEALLEEREIRLDTGLSGEHPLAPLAPTLQVDIRKPVLNEEGLHQHLEHIATFNLGMIDLISGLRKNQACRYVITTSEDGNKWILEICVNGSGCHMQNTLYYPTRTMLKTGDLMSNPIDMFKVPNDLGNCLDKVLAYKLCMEKKNGPLETVQEMTTAITAAKLQRIESCSKVVSAFTSDSVETGFAPQWSRFLGNLPTSRRSSACCSTGRRHSEVMSFILQEPQSDAFYLSLREKHTTLRQARVVSQSSFLVDVHNKQAFL
jgi:hypothetical protein